MPRFKAIDLMNDNRSVAGVNMGHLWDRAAELRAMLGQIFERVAAGDFSPVVDRAFPFDQAAQAHHHIQDRKNFGKVVLVP
jgi:NADPH:quinone reductase-like Zn-dependent oxidoreductase